MDIQISKAEIEDLETILALQKECFISEAQANNDFDIPPLKQDLESIHEEWRKGLILKATIDGAVIGSVRGYIADNTAYIGKLIVKATQQNMGIGKRLMKEIETLLEGVERIEIFTGSKSEKNLQLYSKLGYSVFDEKKINNNLTLVFLQKFYEPKKVK